MADRFSPRRLVRYLPAQEEIFTAGELGWVRRLTAVWAARAGLDEARAADLVIAVNEIAANAVRHGSRPARLVLKVTGTTVVAEVHDHGTWRLRAVPATAGQGGLGLLIAHRLCDQVQIRAEPGATLVMLTMTV